MGDCVESLAEVIKLC